MGLYAISNSIPLSYRPASRVADPDLCKSVSESGKHNTKVLLSTKSKCQFYALREKVILKKIFEWSKS